ncbi:HutD family protein [Rhizobium skierniewicense]|uniref:HutD/Ves family protein n=1 Tax=Rhizobium skierniewicense TaxID=984260 RepID=UPI001FAC0186|nr:HutD family protein [Rhizobium skierniewicense]MCI9866699.1 HutD family protein [Rhizobium skierniewicense]
MKLYRAHDHKRMPWKNGGGETVEIAVFPPGAGVDDFDWRISMATVASDGPFSIFPGIDRTLSILDGAGLSLKMEGGQCVALNGASLPLSFAADIAVAATLPDGPVTDLNVMTRRGRYHHTVERVTGRFSASKQTLSETVLVLVTGDALATSGTQTVELAALDAVEVVEAMTIEANHAVCYVIRIMPQG